MDSAGMKANEWLAAIAQLQSNAIETPAKGFLTMKQVGQMLGLKRSRAGTVVAELVRRGRAEKRTYRIQLAGKVGPVPHYRLTGAKSP